MTERRIGLGCMRLSTAPDRDAARGIAVIQAALDSGVTLLDTADVYCHDQNDIGHNERLVCDALRTWHGDRSRIVVATKGGMVRPDGAWLPDGRAKHLRAACDASRRALDVDVIDLYQLHVVDPHTPLATSARALASLREAGKIARVGFSNVNVAQIEATRGIVEVSAVQVSLSVMDDENLKNGVVEYCRDHGIELIAYRPLGGSRARTLSRDPLLAEIAERTHATAQEVALAWLLELAPEVVPVPGATREPTARSIGRALGITLSADDLGRLDERYSGRLLKVPRASRRAVAAGEGEVVLVMGMPGAGKSTVAHELEASGYRRLNRDQLGGSLSGLVEELDAGLERGERRWVLDNTYATRKSRNEVIECAWRHGVPARCVWVKTDVGEAQINVITRLLEAHGRLPTPDELRERGKEDARYFGPDAQFRYQRTAEPPVGDEGFSAIEARSFSRDGNPLARERALLLDFDRVLTTSVGAGDGPALRPDDVVITEARRQVLHSYVADGWLLYAHAWRPQLAAGTAKWEEIRACFDRTRELLGLDIQTGCCPHPAGPPICWCRRPIPGLILEFAARSHVDLRRSMVVGRAAADRTMAERVGAAYRDDADFFGSL